MDIFAGIIPALKLLTLASVFFVWFIRYENIVKEFEKYNYSPKLRDLVGILKITAVLLINTESSLNIQIGSVLLAFLMLCAFGTHIKVKNPLIEFVPSFILMILSVIFFIHT
jgi:hypothetical protein